MATTGGAPLRPLRFDHRMSAAEALMWTVERDPLLRSSFLNVTFLDRPPDVGRFRDRIALAVERLPRLRQRVRPAALPGQRPEWVDDASFDLDFHVRHVALPPPGTDRQLLDLAAIDAQDAYDLSRPLWQYTIVEGLEGGRAALLAKMHHTISDGVGAVRLSAMFLDLERDALEPMIADGGGADVAPPGGHPVADAARTVAGVVKAAVDPVGTVQATRSLARQALVTERARSPLWTGKRSLARQCEILRSDADAVKRSAKAQGASVNDVFVAAVARGAGAYHAAKGSPVDELRATMPISTRSDRSAGGNSFAPTRVLVPVAISDPREHLAAVHERMSAVKAERAVTMVDGLIGVASLLPAALLVRFARDQVGTVDFAVSNVRGAPFDLYVAGAKVLSNHPMGPTGGTAFNATLLSYGTSLDVGLNIDAAAVDDSDLLRTAIEEAFAALTT